MAPPSLSGNRPRVMPRNSVWQASSAPRTAEDGGAERVAVGVRAAFLLEHGRELRKLAQTLLRSSLRAT